MKLVSNEYGEWDLDFKNGDWVNCTGIDSLVNACIIAIMTRFNELGYCSLYEDFGCRIHEVIKQSKGRNAAYKIEVYVTEVLNNMRRIKTVNWVQVTDNPEDNYYNYKISFSVTSIHDEDNSDGELIEESFYI
ncbi:MAG: DUF2634 domain-containing protein [Methanobrevibacter sp.]|nr:DUF2634 domain-containing protein [Methanosphaera sp.]MBR0369163.1 DUF2634 domain-containing protein [Methanobrevibacter sp.]